MTPPPRDGQILGACPLDCPDTCSWIVTVRKGAPVALRDGPVHPYTRGSLCNKVVSYLAYTRSSDRLLYPMRRTGPQGDPFVPFAVADHYFLNSVFANVPKQQRRSGAATLLIHPADAALLGVAAGDEVRVGNARGSFVAVADVSERIRPGVVASTKGRWPECSKDGTTVNDTVDERDSGMGGGAVHHDNRVPDVRTGREAI